MVSLYFISVTVLLYEAASFAEKGVPPVCSSSDVWSRELNKTLLSSVCSLFKNEIFKSGLDINTEHLTIIVQKEVTSISLKFFEAMKSVHVLNISHNNILGINDLDVFRNTLDVLDMRCNRLSEIKLQYFRGLNHLKFLFLEDNKIQFIEKSSWTYLIGLSVLDVSSNRLDEITNSDFTGLAGLAKLILRNNRISIIESGAFLGLNKLSYLDLRSNNLYRLNADSLRGIEQVSTLLVSDNSFKKIPNGAFQVFKRLSLLDVGGNQIKVLEEDAFLAINVTRIRYCNDLQLTFIARNAFRDCEGLQEIEICRNKHLKYVDKKAFGGDISLQMANFSYNNLSILSYLNNFNFSGVLDLKGNTIKCSCTNAWMLNTTITLKGIPINLCDSTAVQHKLLTDRRCRPELIHSLNSQYNVLAGENIKLHCFAYGSPCPNITWLKKQNRKVLADMEPTTSNLAAYDVVSKNSIFVIDRLSKSDTGQYACYANNDVNEARFDFVLNVRGRNLSLIVLAVSPSTVTVTWTGIKAASLSFILSWRNILSNKTAFSSILHPLTLWKSYRISDLIPSTTYILCLRIVNNSHVHTCAPITTKESGSSSGIFNAKSLVLGIAAAGSIFFILVISCISCFIEKYNKKEKLGCVVAHSTSRDVFLDDISETSPIAYENQMAELYENDIEQLETFPKSLI